MVTRYQSYLHKQKGGLADCCGRLSLWSGVCLCCSLNGRNNRIADPMKIYHYTIMTDPEVKICDHSTTAGLKCHCHNDEGGKRTHNIHCRGLQLHYMLCCSEVLRQVQSTVATSSTASLHQDSDSQHSPWLRNLSGP